MAMKKKILIYKDAGVGGKSFRALMHSLKAAPILDHDIHLVDRHGMQDISSFHHASLLIIPGGRDLPYVENLKGKATENIRQWVEEGGSYLGICAGAYFGSSYVRFEQGSQLEIKGERDLKFFSGEALGPAFGSGVFRYNTEAGARAALLDIAWEEEKKGAFRCYFNGGCTFRGDLSSPCCQVIATYTEIEGNPPAIIRCAVGKGKALLSGVHPEFSIGSLNKNDPYLQTVYPLLEEKEVQRKRLFDSLVGMLLPGGALK